MREKSVIAKKKCFVNATNAERKYPSEKEKKLQKESQKEIDPKEYFNIFIKHQEIKSKIFRQKI